MYLFFAWLAVSLTLTAVELKWGVWKVAALDPGCWKNGSCCHCSQRRVWLEKLSKLLRSFGEVSP